MAGPARQGDAGTVSEADSVGTPISADELVRRGMVMGGRAVAKVTVDFATGQVTCELEPEAETERADLKARIVQVLRKSPDPLTRKQLSRALRLKGPRGRFSQAVSAMVETGEILEDKGELTDDASKFSDDTYT